MTTTVQAIGSDDITKIGVGVIVVLVILGVIAVSLISAIIGRAIVLVVVVVLAVLVWQQRTHVENSINNHACNLNATFFGVHLDAPQDVEKACRSKNS